jgi:hypothetical protein
LPATGPARAVGRSAHTGHVCEDCGLKLSDARPRLQSAVPRQGPGFYNRRPITAFENTGLPGRIRSGGRIVLLSDAGQVIDKSENTSLAGRFGERVFPHAVEIA